MRPAGEHRFDEIRADGERAAFRAFLVLDGAAGGIFGCLIADGPVGTDARKDD